MAPSATSFFFFINPHLKLFTYTSALIHISEYPDVLTGGFLREGTDHEKTVVAFSFETQDTFTVAADFFFLNVIPYTHIK
jgi:hypothetical protein